MSYPFTTSMRLEVDDPTLDTAPRNLIIGGNGALGPYGWITPSGTMVGQSIDATSGYVRYKTPNPAAAAQFQTIPAPVVVGNRIAAAWETGAYFGAGTSYYRARIEFLDTTGTVIGTSAVTGYTLFASGGSGAIASTTIPAATVTARLRFDVYSNNSGAVPTANQELTFNRPRMITQATAISPGFAVQNLPSWRNVFTSATDITIERASLDLGTLMANIPDAAYDPALSTLMRSGRRVRLTAQDAGGVARDLFNGKISSALVKYDPKRSDIKRAQVTLTAVDATADLANASRPKGVANQYGVPSIVEGVGVPWLIDLSTSAQFVEPPAVSRNESASALDQIAITRDSINGFAWVDRLGRINVSEATNLNPLVVATFTEATYGDNLDVAFDVDRVINLVTIKHLRINAATGETVEVPYGPYRHEASIDEWGPRSAEFTVQGLVDNDATMRAYAEKVFAASAVPQVRVNTMTFRVAGAADVVAAKALLDLYLKVRVTNVSTGLDQTARVVAVTHRITPKNWLIDLGFARDGGVAAPQQTPALSSQPTVGILPENKGVFTGMTNVNGLVNVPHGLGTTPSVVLLTPLSGTAHVARWSQGSSDATNALVRVSDSTTNANVASATVSFAWMAFA